MPATAVHHLELDLDVFAGPFDLLLSLILREELDLLEVELADVVLAYLDHLEARDELDLEATTEFLVLIAALLERMLRYARFRGAAGWLRERAALADAVLYRSAPLPGELRRLSVEQAEASYEPAVLGASLGGLLRTPPPVDLSHMAIPRVTLGERLAHLRELLRRGSFGFDDAVRGADRMTVAVTLFALLELYKQGEVTWRQDEPFGDIAISAQGRVREAGAEGIAS